MTFPIESYSSFGEDRLILKFLAKRPAGFYVDVGAHEPRDYSNTYALYRRGWRGLAIDPDPDSIAAFRRDRHLGRCQGGAWRGHALRGLGQRDGRGQQQAGQQGDR